MTNGPLLTDAVRQLAAEWLQTRMPTAISAGLSLGLPEWDDRLELWRVALVSAHHPDAGLGEIRIDAAGAIKRTPDPALVAERRRAIRKASKDGKDGRHRGSRHRYAAKSRIAFPPVPNKAILGDCRTVLAEFPPTARSWSLPRRPITTPSRNAPSMLTIGLTWTFSAPLLTPATAY